MYNKYSNHWILSEDEDPFPARKFHINDIMVSEIHLIALRHRNDFLVEQLGNRGDQQIINCFSSYYVMKFK